MVGGDSGRATPFLRRHRPSAIPNHQPRRNATYHSREAVQTTEASSIQSPDPWLQALFNDDSNTYAETHLTRLYIDPGNGIPPGGSVSVSVPWYSALTGDPDKYVDWWNGGRAVAQPPMRSIRSPQNLGPHSIR